MPTAPRPNSLQQAASAVFAATTVVPLLIFVWTLHRLGSLSRIQSQLGLGLALVIALLGYYIFRRLMGQMSELIRGLGRAVERGARSASEGRVGSAGPERAPGLIAEYAPPAGGAAPPRAMAKRWMGEAVAYQGRRVALSIMNSRVPIVGTLVDLTQDGLLIDQDGGGQVAVSYSRLSGIDAA